MERLVKFLVLFAGLAVSSLAMAEEATGGSGVGLWGFGSGLAMGLGALGGSIGLGLAGSAALGGIARNPSSRDQVFMPMVLVLALVEFQAIMAFIIAFLWLNK